MGVSFLTIGSMTVAEFTSTLQGLGFRQITANSFGKSRIECFIEGSRGCTDGLPRVLFKIDLEESNFEAALREQDAFINTVGAYCSQDADDGDDKFTRLLYCDV